MDSSKNQQKICCVQYLWGTLLLISMYVCMYSSVSYYFDPFVTVFKGLCRTGKNSRTSVQTCAHTNRHTIYWSTFKNPSFLTGRLFQNICLPSDQISSAHTQSMLKLYDIDYLPFQGFSLVFCIPWNFSGKWILWVSPHASLGTFFSSSKQ